MGKFVRTLTITYDLDIENWEVPLFRGAVVDAIGSSVNMLFHNIRRMTDCVTPTRLFSTSAREARPASLPLNKVLTSLASSWRVAVTCSKLVSAKPPAMSLNCVLAACSSNCGNHRSITV